MKEKKSYVYILILINLVVYITPIIKENYYVIDWFSIDDAFYYFKIAENISNGLGSTFDGIGKTNGYHPLWLITLVIDFLLFGENKILALKAIIIIQGILSSGISIVFYQTIQKFFHRITALVGSCILVFYLPIHSVISNGTEAGMNLFFLVLLWSQITKLDFRKEASFGLKDAGRLGILGVLLLFSRLDNLYLISVVGLYLGVVYLIGKWEDFDIKHLQELIKIELLYFGPIFSMLGLFFLWNKIFINSWMPISGKVKRFWGTLGNTVYGFPVAGKGDFLGEFFSPNQNLGPWSVIMKPLYAIVDNFTTDYFLGTKEISLGLLVVILVAMLIGFLVSEYKELFIKSLRDFGVISLLTGALLQIAHYKLMGYLAPRPWYWIIQDFIIVLFITVLIEFIVRSLLNTDFIFREFLLLSSSVILLFLIVKPHVLPYFRLNDNQKVDSHYYLQKAAWLEESTENHSTIGMTGAGSTAYFIENRTIMNLDGLVNGIEYFEHIQNNNARAYLFSKDVDYIFGNQTILTKTDPYQENYGDLIRESFELDRYSEDLALWEVSY